MKSEPRLCQWNFVCRPKSKGGLDFKKYSTMNQALLAKIGWRIQNKDWCFGLGFKRPNTLKGDWWDIDKLRAVLDEDLVQQIICIHEGMTGVVPNAQIWEPTANVSGLRMTSSSSIN
ncbi:unnamed protein product [Prunus armeniaca]